MKKISNEKLQNNAIKAVENAKNILSWNLDISFAKLMLPIIKAFYKKSEEIIDTSYICMPMFLRKKLMNLEGCNYNWFKKVKEYYHKKYIKHIEDLIDALEDILIENSEEWEKKWKIKPFLKIEYDSIPCSWNKEGEPELFEMKVNEKYLENDKINTKNIPYNMKQTNKCYKWRQKQLNWFIKNITKLWW